MKVVCLIPVKLNNERLPNKNTMCFTNGSPLITYILETAKKVENIDDVYVYCSDESICRYLPDGIKFLKRDPYFDLSSTKFNEVLSSFAEKIPADIYVLTHVTAPFITSATIENGVNKVTSGEYDSALSVMELQEFIWKDGKPFNYDVNNIPRTQDLPHMYIETCGLYIYSKTDILQHHRRIGDKPYLLQVSKEEAIDINTREDFNLANAIFNSKHNKEHL